MFRWRRKLGMLLQVEEALGLLLGEGFSLRFHHIELIQGLKACHVRLLDWVSHRCILGRSRALVVPWRHALALRRRHGEVPWRCHCHILALPIGLLGSKHLQLMLFTLFLHPCLNGTAFLRLRAFQLILLSFLSLKQVLGAGQEAAKVDALYGWSPCCHLRSSSRWSNSWSAFVSLHWPSTQFTPIGLPLRLLNNWLLYYGLLHNSCLLLCLLSYLFGWPRLRRLRLRLRRLDIYLFVVGFFAFR